MIVTISMHLGMGMGRGRDWAEVGAGGQSDLDKHSAIQHNAAGKKQYPKVDWYPKLELSVRPVDLDQVA